MSSTIQEQIENDPVSLHNIGIEMLRYEDPLKPTVKYWKMTYYNRQIAVEGEASWRSFGEAKGALTKYLTELAKTIVLSNYDKKQLESIRGTYTKVDYTVLKTTLSKYTQDDILLLRDYLLSNRMISIYEDAY